MAHQAKFLVQQSKVSSGLVAVPQIDFKPSKTSPAALPTQPSKPSDSKPSPPSATSPVSRDDGTSPRSAADVQWEYNVYAQPFVPSNLALINHEAATIVTTSIKHRIDYDAYVGTFVAAGFLPERISAPMLQPTTPVARTPTPLAEETYLDYFTELWRIENAAKERENGTFALYKVPLDIIMFPYDPELFCLSIPGLREDSPLVEMGDTLELRQLWVDFSGELVDIGFRPVHRNWTGVAYHASVHRINRALETVYLRAEGLSQLWMGPTPLPVFVNVVFPLKKRLLQGCWNAMVCVDQALRDSRRLQPRPNKAVELAEQLVQQVAHFIIDDHSSKTLQGPSNEHKSDRTQSDWIRRMLFPVGADGKQQTQLRSVPHRELFDSQVNYEQAHAVNSICTNDYGTLPYLISGPPGTGKTKTLVEVAMQLLNTTKTDHILICAPSDPAADTLAIRLKQYLNPLQLLRLNGPWRADNEVPSELLPYSYMEGQMFALPPFKKLMAYHIIVTACRDAAVLAEARVTNNDLWRIERNVLSSFHPEDPSPSPTLHWGALLIDEAAQATELDVLPAISVVCPPSAYTSDLPQPCLVMAGDEHQLGPKTASQDPSYSTSLFARLFARPLYNNHPLSRSNIKPSTGPPVLKRSMLPILYPPFTNLIRNYRSHPAILSIPSSLFYNDTLIPEAQIPTTPLQASYLWQCRKWPVLFIPHTGHDEIERDGGGWYNYSEARIACDIAQRLVFQSRVAQHDICIMSPFAAQVKLLRALIRSNAYGGGSGLWDVNIGPLEAFQGLEKRVVIICTTRTRERFLEMDAKRGLGIVHQKRKMNVALTRAREGLFVIGNPGVLMKDQHWRAWLAFCWRNGLVSDERGAWKVDGGKEFEGLKVGVLEKALVVRDERRASFGQGAEGGRVLGAGAVAQGMGGEYEAWVEGLREALEEEDQEQEVEDGEAEDGNFHIGYEKE